MKELQKLTKDQLYNRIKEKSENLYHITREALENNFFNESTLDEESLAEFLEMLDDEIAEKIKEASLQTNHENDVPEIVLTESENNTSLELITKEGEGYKIVLIEGDLHLSGKLYVEDYIVLIVTGNIEAENIIINGSLYCSGTITARVLFGASGNDNETYTGGSIMTALIAENGHYTVAEGNIYSRYLISFHNEITGKTGKFIENISLEKPSEMVLLNPAILDQDGYFDEDAFLSFIENSAPDHLFIKPADLF
ncbi:polymer-forming cytoskeletal protein [Chryseobacterium gleum]|uniref:polymer-forming cytoskeletal protein n=1 Tax=Chryseobacterium gleum TaxID=250 RepID=UPI002897BBA3|nr:polymer-forming cytoskeletal protein [Chryseobacterium gleum]